MIISEREQLMRGNFIEYTKSNSYVNYHCAEIEKIKEILRDDDDFNVEFYKNYIRLNGKCFNGITQKIFFGILKEVKNDI